MRSSLAGAAALILVLAGCGGSDEPTASETTSTPSATAATTTAPPEAAEFVVRPGSIGGVSVGITKEQAVATGMFDADVKGVAGCTFELQWKKQYDGVDVLTDEDGTITSLGVREGGPKTSAGVGVGSTLAEIQAAYPEVSEPAELGFGQAGVIHTLGDDHIGFLFGDTTVDSVRPVSKVTFMEVTSGNAPELMRSGC
ncbi:hypothetical protein J2X11_001968 [Aeromicrobium panaciterrae]|uniref:ABC transporter substrate-binding protein n=1 Tax=Aeromicrobium panaciterrae TaxID=363861 RepID=A0ABU1UPM0_9ACTN|nr:hypothetical protein [Aeromicrobium panaciterrae]MDR7087129.1 hypothetical protein [Aeromicrobium panaciterrae]